MKRYLTFSAVTFRRYCCTLQLHKPLCPSALSGIFFYNYGASVQAGFWFCLHGLAMPCVEIVVNILPCYTVTILKMNETEHGDVCSSSLGEGV
jgi:hypothetical protein